MSDDFWGEPIFVYTRKMAIDDGVLIPVDTEYSKKLFKIPMCLTATIWNDVIREDPSEDREALEEQNYMDLLASIWIAIKNCEKEEPMLKYTYRHVTKGEREVIVHIGPDDESRSCFTVGYIEDF